VRIFGADWWDAASAFGTVFATLVAVGLAAWEIRRARAAETSLADERKDNFASARRGTASLVSAWIEVDYEPDQNGTHYLRRSTVIVANESNEPVFDVHVLVGLGRPAVQIGPLAVPAPIPVLPPRRQRSWDISSGVAAHSAANGDIPGEPVARIDFVDSRQVQWSRDFDGQLEESKELGEHVEEQELEEGLRQLGDVSNWLNPMGVAINFLNLIRREDPPCEPTELQPYIAENAHNWKTVSAEDLRAVREDLKDHGLATHPWYRTPQIAYIRLRPSNPQPYDVTSSGYYAPDFRFLTLVFYAGKGWFVHSAGHQATNPEWIEFPRGAISPDPRKSDGGKRRWGKP
jgi:hypothetical protein